MSRQKEYSWGIQTKHSLASGVLVLLSLASFALVSYFVTKHTLDDQMGQRLASHAKMTAYTLQRAADQRILTPEMTSLGKYAYSVLQEKLAEAKNAANLENVILIGAENRVLVDANKELSTGEPYPILKADEAELKSVWEGNVKTSLLYPGKYGRLYKSAYAPVLTKDREVAAVLRVEASAKFLDTINNVGFILSLSAVIIVAMAVLLGMGIARTIVVPIKKLERASQIVANGDLDTEVIIKSRDEIGFFARTFNQMVKNLKKSYDEVEKHGMQIAELSASVAHEVRNSISIIQGYTEVLESDLESGSPDLEYTAAILDEIRMLNSKITDLINFARPLEIESTPQDIVEVLESAIASMEKEAADSNINVITSFSTSLPIVMGDFDQLRGLFLNLIRNSIQAMEKGGGIIVSASIKDEFKQDSDEKLSYLEIKVEDTGCGMHNEDMERAFEPFFTTKGSGTGLGLAIVKKIVEIHNGKIYMESERERGTTVTVCLPIEENKEV
jgi:signal transduction histidine kinase